MYFIRNINKNQWIKVHIFAPGKERPDGRHKTQDDRIEQE